MAQAYESTDLSSSPASKGHCGSAVQLIFVHPTEEKTDLMDNFLANSGKILSDYHVSFEKEISVTITVMDPGDAIVRSLSVQILSLSCSSCQKFCQIISWRNTPVEFPLGNPGSVTELYPFEETIHLPL